MSEQVRPRIAILGRFAEHTSATRREALVSAKLLLDSVWRAGGDPITLLPTEDTDWDTRLAGFSAVLMPGGGDIDPALYGQTQNSDEIYGVNDLQDRADLSLTRWAVAKKVPFLAICRGMQMVNVAFGGTLVQHMEQDHRHVVSDITLDSDVDRLGLSLPIVTASCYHHQAVDRLGDGLRVIATAAQGHVEAIAIDNGGWAYALQWHPEDNAHEDIHQAEIFGEFVRQARAAGPLA
jgi:putative glutamine amidotransferase